MWWFDNIIIWWIDICHSYVWFLAAPYCTSSQNHFSHSTLYISWPRKGCTLHCCPMVLPIGARPPIGAIRSRSNWTVSKVHPSAPPSHLRQGASSSAPTFPSKQVSSGRPAQHATARQRDRSRSRESKKHTDNSEKCDPCSMKQRIEEIRRIRSELDRELAHLKEKLGIDLDDHNEEVPETLRVQILVVWIARFHMLCFRFDVSNQVSNPAWRIVRTNFLDDCATYDAFPRRAFTHSPRPCS